MEETNKRFKEETGYRLKNTSLLHQFDILKDIENDIMLLNIWKSYSIPDKVKNNQDCIRFYIVSEEDWWDLISYKTYENENLWWVVALTNDIVNPFETLDAGDDIKVIEDNYLSKIMKDIRNISEL